MSQAGKDKKSRGDKEAMQVYQDRVESPFATRELWAENFEVCSH